MPEVHHPGETRAGSDTHTQIRNDARLTKDRVIVRSELATRGPAMFVTSAGLQK